MEGSVTRFGYSSQIFVTNVLKKFGQMPISQPLGLFLNWAPFKVKPLLLLIGHIFEMIGYFFAPTSGHTDGGRGNVASVITVQCDQMWKNFSTFVVAKFCGLLSIWPNIEPALVLFNNIWQIFNVSKWPNIKQI